MEKLGEEYLYSLLEVWEHFDDIDFSKGALISPLEFSE